MEGCGGHWFASILFPSMGRSLTEISVLCSKEAFLGMGEVLFFNLDNSVSVTLLSVDGRVPLIKFRY